MRARRSSRGLGLAKLMREQWLAHRRWRSQCVGARARDEKSMSLSRDELLQPSLGTSRIAKAPYSVRTTFLTAFFGGPFAAIAITVLTSIRLQRLGRDALPLAAALLAYLGLLAALMVTPWGASLLQSLEDFAGKQAFSHVDRLIGMGLFGLGYMLHRKEQRSAEFMD